MFDITVEGIPAGRDMYIPVNGNLYSEDGKFLTKISIEYASFSGDMGLITSGIVVDYFKRYSPENSLKLRIRARAFMEPKVVRYLEEYRRRNPYQRIELKLKLRFLTIHSHVYHRNYIYSVEQQSKRIIGLPNDAVLLKAGEFLLFVDSLVYNEVESPISIEGPRWLKDFLPVLGLGSYMLLEIPIPDISRFPEKILENLSEAIRSLQTAREELYKTLSIGPPLTALRNALTQLCIALQDLDLAKKDQGCELDEKKLVKLFRGNDLLVKLILDIFTKAKRIATKGPEPTQPHIAPEPAPTLNQVESLIGIVAFMFKILLDTIAEAVRTTTKT